MIFTVQLPVAVLFLKCMCANANDDIDGAMLTTGGLSQLHSGAAAAWQLGVCVRYKLLLASVFMAPGQCPYLVIAIADKPRRKRKYIGKIFFFLSLLLSFSSLFLYFLFIIFFPFFSRLVHVPFLLSLDQNLVIGWATITNSQYWLRQTLAANAFSCISNSALARLWSITKCMKFFCDRKSAN